ncbi:hypothetical protein [Nocardia sp. NPDC058705]|uniref:hypothetical protein n=1 Tax=Nocardia sp. NPDC058705 TaxID=3346609 RepID=UPI0036773DE4
MGWILLVTPMVLWALIAASTRWRVIGVMVLAVIGFGEYALFSRWVFPEGQLTGIVALIVLTIAILVVAPFLEGPVFAAEESRMVKARRRIGYVAAFVVCLLVGGLVGLSAPLVIQMGRYSWVPGEDAIQPLPDGLVVRESADEGCVGRSSNSGCDRSFVIGANGATAEEISADLRQHLTDTRKCAFEFRATRGYWWGECPMGGWLFDRHETSASVSVRDDGYVLLYLSFLDDW